MRPPACYRNSGVETGIACSASNLRRARLLPLSARLGAHVIRSHFHAIAVCHCRFAAARCAGVTQTLSPSDRSRQT